MNNKGKLGEIAAANYLRKKKYVIEAVNYTSRFGEIDIIARNKKYICFVEVKTRDKSLPIASAAEFVDENKQRKIGLVASQYLVNFPTKLQPRFDVIEVLSEKGKIISVKHLENAFTM